MNDTASRGPVVSPYPERNQQAEGLEGLLTLRVSREREPEMSGIICGGLHCEVFDGMPVEREDGSDAPWGGIGDDVHGNATSKVVIDVHYAHQVLLVSRKEGLDPRQRYVDWHR